MKKKVGVLTLALLCSLSVYCQNSKIMYDEYGPIYSSMNDSMIVYITKEGKQLEIELNQVFFTGGEDHLKEYLRKNYYKPNKRDDDYTYRVFFFILFNSNLRIKEIRDAIPPLRSYTESKRERMKLYIKGIKRTKSKWKKNKDQKWYIYCFSFATD